MILVSLLYRFFKQSPIFDAPKKDKPVWRIRASLIFAQTAVSFAHGANDGQKGIGIMMAILVVFLPHAYTVHNVPRWVIAVIACVLGIGTMI
jgi:inorganic phosphate transporter, PiT family